MMVLVPRIAVAPELGAAPFIFGIRHHTEWRAGLVSLSPDASAAALSNHKVDLALIPSSAWPSLCGGRIVTEYCIGASGPSAVALLLGHRAIGEIRRVWISPDRPTALQLTGWLCAQHPTSVEFCALTDPAGQIPQIAARKEEAVVLTGIEAIALGSLFPVRHDLSGLWKEATGLPFVWGLWAARPEIGADEIGTLRHALTEGIEHGYEALLEYAAGQPAAPAPELLYRLGTQIDYIFDSEKERALKKFWDTGLKASLRTNPG